MASKRKRGAKDSPSSAPIPQKKVKNSVSSATPTSKPALEKLPFVEAPTGDERKREAKLYELLGSEDEDDRIAAADCIVSGLLGGDGVSESILQRHLNRRLFRGLASGRNASRLGFSLVITEILGQLYGGSQLAETKYAGLTFDNVLGLLVENTQAVGNIPGQEERDYFFGQLFGIESFVRSGTLFTDASRWDSVLELLLNLGSKKIWLRSQCGWVIVQAVAQMSHEDAEATLNKITEAGLAKTPEGVAVWLVVLGKYPDLKVKPWRNPLSKKSLADLAAVLKESVRDTGKDDGENSRKNKQAGWTAQLHFVWDIILGYFIKEGDAGVEDFEQFWSRVVDEGLFSKTATDGQKFKGFMVLQKMLEGLADHHAKVRCLFSKHLVTCLMNQAAKEDRYLHRAAVKALKAIESVVSSHPGALVPVLQGLLGKNGVYTFDQRTNARTIDKLLQSITKDTEEDVFDIIREPIGSLSQLDESAAQATLRVYIDYLSKTLTASTSVSTEAASRDAPDSSFGLALNELSRLAYSKPKDISPQALTDQIKELCRTRLEGSLARLTRRADDFGLFCRIISSIDSSSMVMDEAIATEKDAALARMQTLLKRKTKTTQDKSLAQGLAMLHAVSIFQLYNEDPDAMEVLSDLAQFSDRLQKGKLGEKNAGTSEFLVEILLSMVARPSSLMRQVSQQVFDAFTAQISAEGLELLTGPLASSESTKGQQELFNTEDPDAMEVDDEGSSEEEDVEDASDVEIGSDVEFVTLNGADASDASADEDDEEEDEEDSDGGETKEDGYDEPEKLDEALGNILNSHRLDKDAEAASSDDEGDMSDSEMMAMQDKLEAVFKQQRASRPDSKKQKREAKQSVVNFKHRILDLLDIYVKNETLNPFTFSILSPLLNLIRTTSTKPLASRACEIVLNYQKGQKKARSNKEEVEVLEAETLLTLLVEVHDEAGKDNSHIYAKAASAASLIVASTMFAADRATIKQVAAVYAKTQSDWVLGEARLQSSFFADWNNWCQNHASQARN